MGELQKMEPVAPVETQAPPLVRLIERVVMDPSVSVEKLAAMLEMQERIRDREAKAAFDNAVADAKAKIPPILKGGKVDYTNNKGQRVQFKHERLGDIANVVDPILSEHGLSYRYRSERKDGRLFVTCILAHRAGYSEETTLDGPPDQSGSKNDYQAVGSAATYLQRYTLKLALGLAAAHDDDAAGITPEAPKPVTPAQIAKLREELAAANIAETKLLRRFSVEALDDLSALQIADALESIRITVANRTAKEAGNA